MPEHYMDLQRKGFSLTSPRLGRRSRIYTGSDAATPEWLSCTHNAATPLAVGVEPSSVHLPRVASPSFVNPLRQKRYGGQESTPEGRQPWALMRNPVGIGVRKETL